MTRWKEETPSRNIATSSSSATNSSKAGRKTTAMENRTAVKSIPINKRMSILLFLLLNLHQTVPIWAFCPCQHSSHASRPDAGFLQSKKGPDDFFSLYDDEELRNVLNIHRRLAGDQCTEEGAALLRPRDDEQVPMSIHESFLKSQGEETMLSLLDLHESLKKGETNKALKQREQLINSASSKQAVETNIPPSLHDLVQDAVGADVDRNGAFDATVVETKQVVETNIPPSLHDLVQDTVGADVDRNGASDTAVVETITWDDDTLKRIESIRAIASDVDGTLLTSQQTIHPRSRQAVLRAMASPKQFFLATGKSRKGALNSLGVEMTALLEKVPGVFLQGLYCVGDDGNVVFEKKLDTEAIKAVEQLAKDCSVSLVAYDGDNLYSTGMTDSVRELSERYGEPEVRLLPTPLSEHEPGFHKILLVDADVEKLTTTVRSKLDALAEEIDASVTQAVPTMLEWLPEGCSKAVGVSKLCEAMGIDPSTELLAIGDAENDADMLKMASIGVAVGNACSVAQEAADFLMEETNDQGGAGAAMETFGFAIIKSSS